FLAWQRSGYRLRTGLLEGLRVLIAILIAVTLNQPEWREIFMPETKPTLVVLTDTSRSMETRDMIDPANPATEPKSRTELAAALKDTAAWREVEQKMDVVMESFSSREQPEAEGTDHNGALAKAAVKYPHLST